MEFLGVFLIAFIVSYLGSIPPGSINITVMQLSINGYRRTALYFALGAVSVEFAYASVTVLFHQYISDNEGLYAYLQAITAIGLIILGMANLLSGSHKQRKQIGNTMGRRVGYLRGFLLGLVNPLTIPFWLGMTTYLQANGWVSVSGNLFWAYTIGLAVGTLGLLITVEFLGTKFQRIAGSSFLVFRLPGIIFLGMGGYYSYLLLFS